MFPDDPEHDLGTALRVEPGDPGADRGKRNALDLLLLCPAQAVACRGFEVLGSRPAAELHARGVDHILGLQVSAAGDRGLAERDAPDAVALLLNRGAALAPDRSGYAAAQFKVIVRRVDNRLNVGLGDVALDDFNLDHGRSLRPVEPSVYG